MKSIKLIGFLLIAYMPFLAFVAPAALVQNERDLRAECGIFSQAEMRDCLKKKVIGSQKALRQAEEKMANSLSNLKEDRKYIHQVKVQLTASSRDFVKYRDSQCAFASSLRGGGIGNTAEISRLACITELNNRRAEQLRNALSDMSLK